MRLIILLFSILLFLLASCINNNIIIPEIDKNNLITSGNLTSYTNIKDTIYLNYNNIQSVIKIIKPDIFYIQISPTNTLKDNFSYSLDYDNIEYDTNSMLVKSNDNIYIYYKNYCLVVSTKLFLLKIYSDKNLLYSSILFPSLSNDYIFIYNNYFNERFFGLGEKTGDFELTERKFIMYNSDRYKYEYNTDPLYLSIPFYLAIQKYSYGIFIDNPSKILFSFVKNNYYSIVYDNKINLFFIPGINSKEIIQKYTLLTGKPYFPPLWSFGYHQSRYSYNSQTEIYNIINNFEKFDLPIDAIYLDIGFMSNNMSFTYNPKSFPDPIKMNEDLLNKGIKTIAIVDPGIKISTNYEIYNSGIKEDVFLYYKGKHFKGSVWPGMCVFPDFTKEKTIYWWGNLYTNLTTLGISGFWNDMNEPSIFSTKNMTLPDEVEMDNFGNKTYHKYLHNIYGLMMVKASYLGLSNILTNNRIFLLSRAGYSGIQKYAFIWTGDNSANWDHLRMNLYMVLNLGLSGIPYSGADIGGYSYSPDDELFTRWIQLGTFLPFMRNHTEQGTKMQEPYNFKKNLDIIRKFMYLRYQLIPYIYTFVYESHKTGLPIVRPIFLEYGNDYLNISDEFLLGDKILVAPILNSNITKLDVILPEGYWYDFWNNNLIKESKITIPIKIDNIPVFIKSGSIIALAYNKVKNTQEYLTNRDLILKIYPDKNNEASGIIYDDDGISLDYNNEFLITKIYYKENNNIAEIKITKNGSYNLKRKFIIYIPEKINTLIYNNKEISITNKIIEINY